jgi:hypothetical protein
VEAGENLVTVEWRVDLVEEELVLEQAQHLHLLEKATPVVLVIVVRQITAAVAGVVLKIHHR